MRKVIHRNSSFRTLLIGFVLLLLFSTSLSAQDGDPAKGKQTFNLFCASCHNLDKRMTGPALRGVGDKYDREWLYNWISNSSAMVRAGDPQAVAIFEEYNGSVMTAFPQLSNEDIDNIIAYTMEPAPEPPVVAELPPGVASEKGSGISNNVILGALALVFGLLVLMLVLVNKTLRKIAVASGTAIEEEKEKRLPIWKAFAQNQFLVLVTSVLLLLAAGYYAYGYMMQIGVDQGYMPVQPIHFSHKIHAGENQVDCKYCHSSARISKHSGIPSLNVCMNCHKYVSEVAATTANADYTKDFYDKEIQKLYDAVGWDPATQSYTGETKPVKWVRIHNLPDFAYFNHSQHVSVAGIDCQKCHGPVEEMEVVYQHEPLTMGWCINCHRETNVDMKSNEYYEKIHKELSKKYGVEKLTIAQMGGLECGKCHY